VEDAAGDANRRAGGRKPSENAGNRTWVSGTPHEREWGLFARQNIES
jgi:hypothetical protein